MSSDNLLRVLILFNVCFFSFFFFFLVRFASVSFFLFTFVVLLLRWLVAQSESSLSKAKLSTMERGHHMDE